MEYKPNTVCKVCGRKYYHCKASEALGHYKMVACSPECYREWLRMLEPQEELKEIPKQEFGVQVEDMPVADADADIPPVIEIARKKRKAAEDN